MESFRETVRRVLGALATTGRVLTGRQIAGRGVTVFPDDDFLVSYPRSGNTWTRFLLGNLLWQKDPVTFANIESRIPEIYCNPDRFMRALERPRLLKSPECFQPHYARMIYIVRGPRDVAISFYHHNVKARNIPDEGSGFLMLRYEDMKRDPATVRAGVAAFLERGFFHKIDASPEALQRTIEISSLERMRAVEKQQVGQWVLTKGTRSDKPFVCSAISGGWKSQLASESVAAIESAWGDLMEHLGYALVSGSFSAATGSHGEIC